MFNMQRSHQKHFATATTKIIAQSAAVLHGLIFAMRLAVFGICLCTGLPAEVPLSASHLSTGLPLLSLRTTTRKGLRRERGDRNFSLCLGVFSGLCPLAGPIHTCFQQLLDFLHYKATSNASSYSFKLNLSALRDTSAYANVLEICSWSATCCQSQLDLTNSYLLWSMAPASTS